VSIKDIDKILGLSEEERYQRKVRISRKHAAKIVEEDYIMITHKMLSKWKKLFSCATMYFV